MELYRFELNDLAAELKKELANGNRFMVTDGYPNLSAAQRGYFTNGYDAAESTYENATDLDHYDVYRLKELIELVDIGIKNAWRLPEIIQTQYLLTLKTEAMEENNVKYLENDLKYAGFGDRLNVQMKEKIAEGLKDFTLKDQVAIGKDKMDYFLHFKQGSKNENIYFFNSYDAILKKEGSQEEIRQTFFQNQRITAKEAYNLLDGRAVYKTELPKKDSEQTFNAWIKIDFSEKNEKGNNHLLQQYTDNYGYDIEKRLQTLPLKEVQFNDKMGDVIKSLKKGNITPVTLEVGDQTTKIFLEANPKIKDFNSFRENMEKDSSQNLKLYRELKHDPDKAQTFADELKKKEAQKPAEQTEQKNTNRKGRKAA